MLIPFSLYPDPEEQPGPNGLDLDVKGLTSDSADQLGEDGDSLQDACSDQAQQTTPGDDFSVYPYHSYIQYT